MTTSRFRAETNNRTKLIFGMKKCSVNWDVDTSMLTSCFKLREAPHRRLNKFSLTSSLVAFPAFVYDEQVFFQQFSLTSFNCSCVYSCITSFWTRLLVKEKLVNLCRAHEQINLVEKKKLVKENMFVCEGHNTINGHQDLERPVYTLRLIGPIS